MDNERIVDRILAYISCVSVIILIGIAVIKTYYSEYECFKNTLFFLEIINTLSSSYIISYVFFLIALMPEKRRKKSIDQVVTFYLNKIIICIDEIKEVLIALQLSDVKDITKESPNFISSLDMTTGRREFLTYERHFCRFFLNISEYYENLLPYTLYIDDYIRDVLFEMMHSDFVTNIKELLIEGESDYEKNIYLKSLNYEQSLLLLSDVYNGIKK